MICKILPPAMPLFCLKTEICINLLSPPQRVTAASFLRKFDLPIFPNSAQFKFPSNIWEDTDVISS